MNDRQDPILEFRGPTYWLSNFYPVEVRYGYMWFPSVECAYQAAKFPDTSTRELFQTMTSKEALAYAHEHMPDPPGEWHLRKIAVMYHLLMQKFHNHPHLKQRLRDTGNAHLEEGNTHGDVFWGTVDGEGENCLGILLMEVRSQITLSWDGGES